MLTGIAERAELAAGTRTAPAPTEWWWFGGVLLAALGVYVAIRIWRGAPLNPPASPTPRTGSSPAMPAAGR